MALVSKPRFTLTNQFHSGLWKRDDVVHGGALPAETGQRPSNLPAAGNRAHVDEEQEPVDAVNIKDLEPDDIVIACVIKVSMAKTSDVMFASVMGPTGSGKTTVRRPPSSGACSLISPVVHRLCERA